MLRLLINLVGTDDKLKGETRKAFIDRLLDDNSRLQVMRAVRGRQMVDRMQIEYDEMVVSSFTEFSYFRERLFGITLWI